MAAERIYVNNTLFLGRVEEQKRFRAALQEVLDSPRGETLPYIFLLYGDGGMGKTTLARRFRDIAQEEAPFEGEFQLLWVDWEDERRRTTRLQVGREHVSPETVFDILHEKAVAAGWSRDFMAYQDAVSLRATAERQAAAALEPRGERDDLAALRGAGAGAIARILRLGLPVIGETGEKLAQAFLEAGFKIGIEQAARLRAELERRLRARLDPRMYDIFLNPNQQLARALAQGLQQVARRKPLLIVLDTYEIVDRADIWLREVIRAAGPRLVWVLSGRDDLVRSRQFGDEYFKGYAEDFPRRLVAFDMLQLAREDLRAIFAERAPGRPLDEAAVTALSRATRGVPLAIQQAAEMWARGVPLADIIGDVDEATPRREIVQKMTTRYFLHAPTDDRFALYALALARGDVEILRAMLHPEGDADGAPPRPDDLESRLRHLERDYASVHYERYRLHDDPAFFILEYLKQPLQRTDARLQQMLQRAVQTLRARLERLQADLPRLEDRCADDDWVKAALDLTDYLFWLEEAQAWRWLTPRFVEGLAYARDLRRGLLEIAKRWRDHLSANGKKRLRALRVAEDWFPSPDEQSELLDELTRLERQGYLGDEHETERCAILAWRRGRWLYERGKYTEALEQYERAEGGLPPEGEALKTLLGEALYDLAGKFLWPQDAGSAVYSAEAERILPRVVAWLPEKQDAWYRLGVALRLSGKNDEALAAYARAIELDPKDAAPHYNMANIFIKQGKFDEARRELQERIRLAPENTFTPLVTLGILARYQGLPESDEHFQRALTQWEAAWCARWQSPAGLLKNKAIALLCLGRKDEALQILEEAIAQMTPGETIEFEFYDLLQSAPQPPEGIAEMIARLKEAQAKRKPE